ncbi:MAG: single-stranded DNA-binding protein [Pseudonocardiaceae bacterium]
MATVIEEMIAPFGDTVQRLDHGSAFLTGTARLTADLELRFASFGVAVCSLQLVFNSRRQYPSGAWVEGDVLFILATAFRALAEHCAETLSKALRSLLPPGEDRAVRDRPG